jgi:hypothetical protein
VSKAQCVVIVPGLKKAAIVVGGEYGRGFAVYRNNGGWGGPAAIRFSGGSFGAQIGAESRDVVMLVMNRHGMETLATDKFTIGADLSAAAGPVGRTAAADTDIRLQAEILSYSRAPCPRRTERGSLYLNSIGIRRRRRAGRASRAEPSADPVSGNEGQIAGVDSGSRERRR